MVRGAAVRLEVFKVLVMLILFFKTRRIYVLEEN